MSSFLMERGIFDNAIWQDPIAFRLFFYLVGNALFKDKVKIGSIELRRGQYLRSYRNLQNDLAYVEDGVLKSHSFHTIKRCIDVLKQDGRIETQETRMGTIFTILNYEQYQTLKHKEHPKSEVAEENTVVKSEIANTTNNSGSNTTSNSGSSNKKQDIQEKQENNSSCPRTLRSTDAQRAVAVWMLEKIREINPGHKLPNLDRWANDIRLMVEQDERSLEAIKELFSWANKNSFWSRNILSPGKLREKWDQLKLSSGSVPGKPYGEAKSPNQLKVDRILEQF